MSYDEYQNDQTGGTDRDSTGQDSTYHYSGDPVNQQEVSHPAPVGGEFHYANAQGGYQADGTQGEPPKQRRRHNETARRVGTRAAALVLVGAVAFAGGYAGNRVATSQSGRIIIQKAENTLSSGTSGANALSSTAVANAVTPTVVAITTEQMVTTNTWFGGQQVVSGAGSGVILSADGYILTCAHVVDGADKIKVELSDGTDYEAKIVGSYVNGDIAVIKIDATGLTAAVLGDSSQATLGEPVYAVGNPEGTLSGTITDGIISSLNREIQVQVETSSNQSSSGGQSSNPFYQMSGGSTKTISLNCIQMSASVSPGNSGGGLFNSRGELVGIVNAKSSSDNSEGLGFAIPINTAMDIAKSLIESGSYVDPTASTTPMLGITAVYMDEATAQSSGYKNAGVYVYSVSASSTVQSGLTAGDRIISVDGSVINALTDISDVLSKKQVGDKVSVAVERSGQMQTVEVTLVSANS